MWVPCQALVAGYSTSGDPVWVRVVWNKTNVYYRIVSILDHKLTKEKSIKGFIG